MAAGKTPQTAESTDELTDGSRGSNLLLSALLAIFIVLTAGTFERFPGMTFVSEGWIALVLGYALIVYPYTKITGGWRLSSLEVYVFGLLGVIPILAGISARMEFGQPLIFGLLAQRDMALVFGSVILLQAFRRYPRLLDATETALMIVVWGTLSIYIGVMILFDPADLASREIGIVTGGAVSRAVFKFDHLFIVFGFLYYGFRGFRRRSWSDYGLALVLLAWLIVGAGGRSMLLAAIGSYVLLVILRSNWSRRLTWLASATVVSLSLISILYALAPGSIAGLGQKFSAAALVLATGESGEDFSSNSRILQFLLVLPYLLSNWLLGSGVLSNQWHGGYDGVLGAYFFPSDRGSVQLWCGWHRIFRNAVRFRRTGGSSGNIFAIPAFARCVHCISALFCGSFASHRILRFLC